MSRDRLRQFDSVKVVMSLSHSHFCHFHDDAARVSCSNTTGDRRISVEGKLAETSHFGRRRGHTQQPRHVCSLCVCSRSSSHFTSPIIDGLQP